MDAVLRALAVGQPVILDSALGSAVAAGVLHDTKRLLASGQLRSEEEEADRARKERGVYSGQSATDHMHRLRASMPRLWDGFRLVARWSSAAEAGDTPAIAAVVNAIERLHAAIGAAEASQELPLSPAWPASGLVRAPHAFLLSIAGFNGTRVPLHTDSGALRLRKLTTVWYPLQEPAWRPGVGGELRVHLDNGSAVDIEPKADRMVLYHSELPHEVLFSRGPRMSLSCFSHGVGARLRKPPIPVDTDGGRCSSDMCRSAVARGRKR